MRRKGLETWKTARSYEHENPLKGFKQGSNVDRIILPERFL